MLLRIGANDDLKLCSRPAPPNMEFILKPCEPCTAFVCFLLFRVASIESHQKKGNDNPKRSSFNRQVQGRDTILLSQIGSRIDPSPGLSIASDGKTISCHCSRIGKPATVVSDVSATAHLVRAAYLSLNGYGYIRHPLLWCFLIRSRHINHSRAFRRACYLIPRRPKNIDVWETQFLIISGLLVAKFELSVSKLRGKLKQCLF